MSCKGQFFQCEAEGLDMGIKAFTVYTIGLFEYRLLPKTENNVAKQFLNM